jgi:hypothetical protein
MESAKSKFEKERETILKSLPDNLKSMFNEMGFCKVEVDEDDEENVNINAGDEYVPCLILSPYSVPPRPVRDVYWFDLYSKCKRTKKLGEMEYLVYHYGSNDPLDCYSFIPHENFKSYDSGVAEGLDRLPESIQAKLDAGEELTEEEEMRVRGLEEMKEDAAKPAEERRRGNWEFKERHEALAEGKEPAKKRQRKK